MSDKLYIYSFAAILFSYLIGCFSTGYYLVYFSKKIDIRLQGSGSVGASNVGRLLGKKGFYLTLLGDIFRGILTLTLLRFLNVPDWLLGFSLCALVIGHIWPFQLSFRGGKGVAIFLGGLLIWDYRLLLILGVLFFLDYLIFLKAKKAAFFSMIYLPIVSMLLMQPITHYLTLWMMTLIIFFAHRDNILQKPSKTVTDEKSVERSN